MRARVVPGTSLSVTAVFMLSVLIASPGAAVDDDPTHRLDPATAGLLPAWTTFDPPAPPDLPERVEATQRPEPPASLRDREPATPSEYPTGTKQALPLADEKCTPHPPIHIVGDEGTQGFIVGNEPVFGTPVHRPGSGVTAGSGTQEDPYVIEGWCLQAHDLPAWLGERGFHLSGTDAHVVIRDNLVTGFRTSAFWLVDADNVTIANNRVLDNGQGLFARWTENLQITGNRIEDAENGATLEDTTNSRLLDNRLQKLDVAVQSARDTHLHLEGNEIETLREGVRVEDGHGITLRNNTFGAEHLGIGVLSSTGILVETNTVHHGYQGIVLETVTDAEVRGNDLKDQASETFLLSDYQDVEVVGNTIQGGWRGIRLEQGSGAAVHGNVIKGSNTAVLLNNNEHLFFTHNTLRGNDDGIRGQDGSGVTIAHNRIMDNELGAVLTGIRNLTLEANTIQDHAFSAVWLGDVEEVRFAQNLVEKSLSGLFLTQATEVEIASNTIRDHDRFAFAGMHTKHVSLLDNQITDNDGRVWLHDARNLRITGNTFEGPNTAMSINEGEDVEIRGNLLRASDSASFLPAVRLSYLHGVHLEDNRIQAPTGTASGPGRSTGIYLWAIEDGVVRGNAFDQGGFFLNGDEPAHFEHTIDSSNTIDGRPVVYHHGVEDVEVDPDAAQVILVEAHGAQVRGITTNRTSLPITVHESHDVVIEEATLRDGEVGIVTLGSDRLRIADSTIEGFWAATAVQTGVDAELTDNRFARNEVGLVLYKSPDALVHENTLEANTYGLGMLDTEATTVELNEIRDNQVYGVILIKQDAGDRGGHQVHMNNIHGNLEAGVYSESNHTLDARFNWWGCSDGPGDPGCDAVEGDVDVTDWRLDPVPDAGAA